MDIGANTGKFSLATLAYNAEVKMHLVDLPKQLAVAEQNLKAAGVRERANLHPIDLLDDADVAQVAAEGLKKTLLMFDYFHDVAEKLDADARATALCRAGRHAGQTGHADVDIAEVHRQGDAIAPKQVADDGQATIAISKKAADHRHGTAIAPVSAEQIADDGHGSAVEIDGHAFRPEQADRGAAVAAAD